MKIAIVTFATPVSGNGNGNGPVNGTIADVVAEAARCVRTLFACEAEPYAPLSLPAGSYDARRKQYSSVAFMLALARGGFGDADRVIGLTECDLFIPMLTFVFGQAQLKGRVALVSLARLRQEFYGAAPDPEPTQFRLDKEIGHELGHSFGLIHCSDRECLMSLATSIQDVDRKGSNFCQTCRQLLAQEIPDAKEIRASKEGTNESEMADSGRR